MKAEPEYLIDLMFDNKRQYQIPVYQRNYDWKKENCVELYNDIIRAYEKEKTHFLGTIVQVNQDDENGIKQYIIIDGQQRTTSIYILLKALYDSASKEEDKNELIGYLYNSSNNKEYTVLEKNKLKLKPIKSDNEQFLYLMKNELEKMDKTSNIFINYEKFKELIKLSIEKGYSIKNIIKGLKYLEIVMISLKESNDGQGDDPQVVFERINSTGEDLTLADLIRNFVLMTDKNREQLFEKYWITMEEDIGKTNLVDYFMNYLTFKLPEQIVAANAYQSFKKYVEINKVSNENILVDLKRYSKYYKVFITYDKNYSDEINNLLEAFRALKQTTIFVFLFNIFDDYENNIINEENLIELLVFFLNYTIRRLVCGVPSNSLRGLYKTLYKRIFTEESNKDKYLENVYRFMNTLALTKDSVPNDTSFKEGLMYSNVYKNTKLCKYILKTLENGALSAKESVNVNSLITIEHIMPQNKNDFWEKEMGSDYQSIHEKYLHTLGNLTLTGYNSELSDKAFIEKIKLIKEKSKFISLNEDVIDKTHWNAQCIVSRAERLSTLLLSYFKLPEIISLFKISSNQLNKHTVMDGADFTNTNPVSYILLGESVNVDSYRNMLSSVLSTLYNIDSKILEDLAKNNYKIPEASRIYITNDKNLQKSPLEIANSGIYIETNLNSNASISFIKAVLSEYDLSNDDFIFFIK